MATIATPEEKAKKEVRRLVRIAVSSGGKVAFSMRVMIDAGIGVDAIRKVYRNENG